MSDLLSACKALAAMVRDHGEPNVDELRFVAHAALELGLDPDQNIEVQETLKSGGDFSALIADVQDADLRVFLFRKIVSVTMIDDEINDAEKAYIAKTAKAFGYNESAVNDFVAWLQDGLEWEKRGIDVMSRLGVS